MRKRTLEYITATIWLIFFMGMWIAGLQVPLIHSVMGALFVAVLAPLPFWIISQNPY